ncbi:hypothetical protein BLNAU_2691 [Blattamonas nauphoetae]|uniref:YEATS domain-containing protein n=1 Tax=Blattamonas nauphoetae TaxID=2049346 RepID=A0ABQ9YF99_9EUKA|nr:hypothetical protein BLNAU_2691 [Blattamonas nauphoetae]
MHGFDPTNVDLIYKPICYGNTVKDTGLKDGNKKIVEWTAYIRSPYMHDLGSFEEPIIVVSSPPFQISRQGWGEFDIEAEIVIRQRLYDNIIIRFPLKLFSADKSVVHFETYDELLFFDPTPSLQELLRKTDLSKVHYFCEDETYKPNETLQTIHADQERFHQDASFLHKKLGNDITHHKYLDRILKIFNDLVKERNGTRENEAFNQEEHRIFTERVNALSRALGIRQSSRSQ